MDHPQAASEEGPVESTTRKLRFEEPPTTWSSKEERRKETSIEGAHPSHKITVAAPQESSVDSRSKEKLKGETTVT